MATPKPAEQTEAIPAVRVKFNGMATDELVQGPELDDIMTFTVTAKCTEAGGRKRLKSGELRAVVAMDVLECEVIGDIVKAPAEQQLALVEDDS